MLEGEKLAPGSFINRFSRYAPPIIWAMLIFIGSSSLLSANNTSSFLARPLHFLFPGVSETTLLILHFTLRKAGHFTEYAILAALVARALRTSSRQILRNRWFLLSLLVIVVYALSDEFHQSFVPSRTASIYDSMIDSAGGLFGLLFARWRLKRTKAKKKPGSYS
jgi:VanZ family protein